MLLTLLTEHVLTNQIVQSLVTLSSYNESVVAPESQSWCDDAHEDLSHAHEDLSHAHEDLSHAHEDLSHAHEDLSDLSYHSLPQKDSDCGMGETV
jgi:hypothetical protein